MRITSIVSGTVHTIGVWQSYYTNTLLPDLTPSLILSKHYHELYIRYNERVKQYSMCQRYVHLF